MWRLGVRGEEYTGFFVEDWKGRGLLENLGINEIIILK